MGLSCCLSIVPFLLAETVFALLLLSLWKKQSQSDEMADNRELQLIQREINPKNLLLLCFLFDKTMPQILGHTKSMV